MHSNHGLASKEEAQMRNDKKKDKERGPLRPWLVDVVVDIQK
jgi:hypothetical protein